MLTTFHRAHDNRGKRPVGALVAFRPPSGSAPSAQDVGPGGPVTFVQRPVGTANHLKGRGMEGDTRKKLVVTIDRTVGQVKEDNSP